MPPSSRRYAPQTLVIMRCSTNKCARQYSAKAAKCTDVHHRLALDCSGGCTGELTALCTVRLSCHLVGLIDKLHGAVAIVHAHGRRCATLPVLQGLTQYQHVGRLWRDGWQRFCPLRRDDPQDVILEHQDGIPTGDLPFTICAVAGEGIADLKRAQYTALRAQKHGGVVFYTLLQSTPAELRAGHLRGFAGKP